MRIKLTVIDVDTQKVLEDLGYCNTDNIGRAVEMYDQTVDWVDWLERGYNPTLRWVDVTDEPTPGKDRKTTSD